MNIWQIHFSMERSLIVSNYKSSLNVVVQIFKENIYIIDYLMQEGELPKPIKIIFKLVHGAQSRVENYPWISITCQIAQILTIVGFIVVNCLSSAWQEVDSAFNESYLDLIDLAVACFSYAVIVLLLIIFCIEFIFFKQQGTLHQHKSIININGIACTILLHLVELFYQLFSLYLFWEIAHSNLKTQPLDFILNPAGVLLFMVQSLLFCQKRPYKLLSFTIPLILTLVAQSIGTLILLVVTIIVIYQEVHNLNKLYYAIVILTCAWTLLQLSYSPSNQFILSFANLLAIIACCIGIFFFYPLSGNGSLLSEDKKLLNYYKCRANSENNERSDAKKDINLEEELCLQRYLEEIEHKEHEQLHSQTRSLPFYEWKAEQKSDILWEKLVCDKKKDPSFEMSLCYFEGGILLKRGVMLLLKQMVDEFGTNNSYNIFKKYEMYKLSQQIYKDYQSSARINESSLDISDIIQIERNYNQFYIIIDQLMDQLAFYWRELASNNFQITMEVQDILQTIVNLQSRMQSIVNNLKEYRITEEMKLFTLVNGLINNYQVSNSDLQPSKKSEFNNNFEYIIMEGQCIHKMSLKLLRALEYEPSDLEGHSVRSLLPSNFHLYLHGVYEGFLQRGEHSQFLLPVLHSSGYLVLKRCTIYMIPSTNITIKYLLSFDNVQQPNQLYLLYNTTRQRIQLFNDLFREFLGMKVNYFQKLAQRELSFFPNDLFQCDLLQGDLKMLRNNEALKMKVSYGDFYHKSNCRYNYNDEVTLQFIQSYSFDGHEYSIINVQSESFRQNKIDTDIKIAATHSFTKQRNMHEEYANQTFFCRIENPYKSKIVEKMSHIRKRGYRSSYYQISLLKVLLYSLVMVNIVIFKYFSAIQQSEMSSLISTMHDLNNQYVHLLRLFSNCYSNKLFTQNIAITKQYIGSSFYAISPPDAILSGLIMNLTGYYNSQNDFDSEELMKTYLLYKAISGHRQMSYIINFGNFEIQTNTLLTTFYDFIIQVEQGFSDGSVVPFLVKNYNSVISIMPTYEQYLSFNTDFMNSYQYINIAACVYVVVMSLLIIFGFTVTYRMVRLHIQIRSLYNFIERPEIIKVMKILDRIRDNIGQIRVSDQKRESKDNYEDLFKKTRVRSAPAHNHSIQLEDAARQQKEMPNKPNCKNDFQTTFKLILFCPMLAIFTIGVIYFEYTNNVSDQLDFQSITSLQQKFQVDQMWIERSYIDLLQPTYYGEYYGSYSNPYENNTILKNHFSSPTLPDVFQSDVDKQQSLCQSIYTSSITIPIFNINISNCSGIESGVLMQGYSESLELYQSYIRKEVKMGYRTYLANKVKGAINQLSVIIYARELLRSYLDVRLTNFMTNLQIYAQESESSDTQIAIYTFCLSLVILVALVVNIIKIRRKMNIVIQLICLIPTSAMYKMKMTNFIRKESILDEIDKL